MKKKITDARADKDGDIISVKFRGNKGFTPLETAIKMAEKNQIKHAHVSKTGAGKKYLRTDPDNSIRNNLDEMAGDHKK